jgi:LmbE family N-acetylglucosaminyl deacetylase
LHSNKSFISRITGIVTLGWSDTPRGRLRLRKLLSGMARIGLRVRGSPLPLGLFKSVVVVAPHPDDETLGCGGTLALLARRETMIYVVFVTDGGASHPTHQYLNRSDIGAMRTNEARAATGTLGIKWDNVIFADAPDGKLANLDHSQSNAVISRLSEILCRIAPDAIFMPLRGDGSSDHDASYILTKKALKMAGSRPRILEFPVWAWRNPLLQLKPILQERKVWRVDIKSVLGLKIAAIDAYASQVLPLPPDTQPVLPQEFVSEFLFAEEFLFER